METLFDRMAQREAADTLLDRGLSVPLLTLRLPWRRKPWQLRAVMRRPRLGGMLLLAREYLALGTTAAEFARMTREEQMAFLRRLAAERGLLVLTDSDARVLFCTKQHAAILEKFPAAAQALRAVILLDEPAGDGKLSFAELLREGYRLRAEGESSFEEEQSDPLALKMLVYTSGTTGLAKGVMLSEHNLCSSIFYGLQRCTPGRVGLSVLHYHHVYEAVPGILVAIHHHCTLCLNENLRSVSKNMLRYKPDYIYLVPAFVEAFYKKTWASIDKKGKRRAANILRWYL